MDTLVISKSKFKKLERLKLANYICNTESEIYILPDKDKWTKKDLLFKKLYVNNGDYFSNKLYTVNTLIDSKNDIGLEELVLPERLAILNGEVAGFAMEYIKGKNLQTILNSSTYTEKEKIEYLKEVGEIIEKVRKVRRYKSKNNEVLKDFYLNDIHESNFILNNNTGKLNVLDMDSAKINNNKTFPAKYLRNEVLRDLVKYEVIDNNLGSIYEVNKETELYCYNTMILNYLYGDNTSKFTLEEFYEYMEYLISIGVPQDIVFSFERLYTEKCNKNPMDALDDLSLFVYRSNKYVYKLARKKK